MKTPLLPMLAVPAAPFDAEDYEFEVKWDGVRALAAIEPGHWQLWGRTGSDYTSRYPELAVLQGLPAGTVVDGELVVLQEGRANFSALLRRHQQQQPCPAGAAGSPICYILFDLLSLHGNALLREALVERRRRLRDLLERVREPLLVYSTGVAGSGREFFTQALAQGHEGVIAKKHASHYRPGKRSPAWRKIKPAAVLPCVVIGYRPGSDGIDSLQLASVRGGVLGYVGQVRRGFGTTALAVLAHCLKLRRRTQPVVPCPKAACWVEPELYCQVRYQDWTCHGRLRHAVFGGWIEAAD